MHAVDPYDWGPAAVTYPDWQGTFQIDQKITGPTSLYDLTGVDDEEWQIIGFDWGAGESGPHEPHVIVVPKDMDIEAEVSRLGYVPATDLMLHEVDAYRLLLGMVHITEFRARARHVVNKPIKITRLGDIPEQE